MWKSKRVGTGILLTGIYLRVFTASIVFAADADEQEIKDLMQELISTNKEPPPPKPHTRYQYPMEFDQSENERVIKARDKLLAKGVAAFPYLIEELDNSSYSFTQARRTWAHHFHVREVCFSIIALQVEVFHAYSRTLNVQLDQPKWLPVPKFRLYPGTYWPKGAKGFMQKWWNARQTMTLLEIQQEAVEWAVQFEEGRGFVSDEEESLVLGWYKPLQARLSSSKKAIQVTWNGEFVGEEGLKPKAADVERAVELWSEYEKKIESDR